MKKLLITNLVLFLFAFCIQVNAQYVVSHAKAANIQQEGFYYSLPRNLIRLDFILEEISNYKGPYSDYASKMLGVNDYITSDGTEYKIIDVVMSIENEPDPDATFFVAYDEKSKDAAFAEFTLNNGIIVGIGEGNTQKKQTNIDKTIVNSPDENRFHYFAEHNLYQRTDTIVRKITIDTTTIRRNIYQTAWVDRNMEQKARDAADYIRTIRDARFKLINGYQEINYGSSMVFMNDQLLTLEEEYLSLFIGKKVSKIVEKTVYYIPTKDVVTQVVAKFAETSGILNADSKIGNDITINITPSGNTSTINALSTSAIESAQYNNRIFYRLPEIADISLSIKSKVYANQRTTISQLGAILVAPLNRTKLSFDQNTGQIISIGRE